jgi:hypothetical protein
MRTKTTRPSYTATDTPAMTDPKIARLAIAMLTLGACGAHSFSVGGGPTASPGSSPAGYSSPTGQTPGGSDLVPIDPNDPITSVTDRVNASTPNNAGRANSYPKTNYHDDYLSYGEPGAERGDGYYVRGQQRWLILAGYTPDEAIRRAKSAGYVGRINVTPFTDGYNAQCAAGTVCQVVPQDWQARQDGELDLYVNRSAQITAPE